MNKKILVGVIVLLLLLGGGGAYLAMKKPSTTSTTSSSNSTTTAGNTQGTLKSLFASGKSQKCTFNSNANASAKVDGTVYVTNGKMRGDFQTIGEGANMSSHMIMDGQTSYVWTDASKQGFKMDMSSVQQANGSAANNQGPDLNSQVDYSCENWSVDNSLLALPTDVTFTAFAMPMMASPGAPQQGTNNDQCAMCLQIPAGANQDACKAQLHCQ